ncbi:hypothetical protein, partial [Lentzea tibetensis]|uniref:hypothetical protein n=1 Tax=Lentzea tibetensis TaxID=2591470 RepID=UPI001C993EB3
MRIKFAGLLAAVAAALMAVTTMSAPAMADPAAAGEVGTMASEKEVRISFYNNGWYWAYADVWGKNDRGEVIYHDFSGSVGHSGGRWFTVPAKVAKLEWKVRMEPFGDTIHDQYIDNWYDFACTGKDAGKHATMY